MKIEFAIPYPRGFTKNYGLNAYYSGMHWAVRKQRADYWHSIVRAAMIEQRVPRKLLYKPVKITFCWDDRLDIDNHAIAGKMTVDAMKGYLLQEDSRRYVRAVEHRYWDRKCIGVEIEEADDT